MFSTCARWPFANQNEYGSNPASSVPTSDQPLPPIGSLILTPMTDWLMPLGVHSHFGPLLCLVMMFWTPLGKARLKAAPLDS